MNTHIRRFLPVGIVAAIAAMLAYVGSFAVPPTYEASTRLLIRGRDTTFLTSTGAPLTQQPGVVDIGLATALGETQSALLSSRAIAEEVVDRLALDAVPPEEPSSLAGRTKSFAVGAYKRVRAWLTAGFYAEPEPREAAVAAVYGGLGAAQIDDSYVLELRARWDGPELAAAIADTAADALVALSLERFRADASAHRDYLASQVDRAEDEVATARESVRAYKTERGITDLQLQVQLTTTEAERLDAQARDLVVRYDGARAELASIQSSLAQTRIDASSTSTIVTGRSTTEIEQVGSNSAYQALLAEEARAEAEVASLGAQIARLEAELTGNDAEALAGEEAELAALQQRYAAAAETYELVSAQYQSALLTVGLDPVEVSRVDAAGVPTYPIAPVRYLYLGMGGLVGAALGLALAARAARRRGERLLPDLTPASAPVETAVPATRTIILPEAHASAASAQRAAATPAAGEPGSGRFEVFAAPERRRSTRRD